MGCDIHIETELLHDWSGTWHNIAVNPLIDSKCIPSPDFRNYKLFGLLAGVRDEASPLVELRGLPKDVDYHSMKRIEEWVGDAHSVTWYLLSELRDYDELREFPYFTDYLDLLESACDYFDTKATRLIIYFDS